MTSIGDLCPCGDLAAPGQDWCRGCLNDAAAARAVLQEEIALTTEQEEAKVIEQDEVWAT